MSTATGGEWTFCGKRWRPYFAVLRSRVYGVRSTLYSTYSRGFATNLYVCTYMYRTAQHRVLQTKPQQLVHGSWFKNRITLKPLLCTGPESCRREAGSGKIQDTTVEYEYGIRSTTAIGHQVPSRLSRVLEHDDMRYLYLHLHLPARQGSQKSCRSTML